MAWNGTGTFSRTNGTNTGATVWAQDEAGAVDIESDRHDTHDQDLADGINACLAKNGENAMTGNLPMGGNDITNCNAATIATANITNALASKLVMGDESELTISSGAVTATTSYHQIDTEGDASSDDLDTITFSGSVGTVLAIRSRDSARTVVVKNATGNLRLAGDFSMSDTRDTLTLIWNGTLWFELARSAYGFLTLGGANEVTISSGAITATAGFLTVDTESDASTDDLDTINGGRLGAQLVIRSANSARDVVVKDGTGNLALGGGDFTLSDVQDKIMLIYDGSDWCEVSRSNNT